ncbi:hypothetical protein BJX65DRAFT_314594 [Aspergillus insuetus]
MAIEDKLRGLVPDPARTLNSSYQWGPSPAPTAAQLLRHVADQQSVMWVNDLGWDSVRDESDLIEFMGQGSLTSAIGGDSTDVSLMTSMPCGVLNRPDIFANFASKMSLAQEWTSYI